MEEQQQFYSSLIEQSGEVAIVLEKEGAISFESANMKQIFGYDTSERIGRNGFEYIHSRRFIGAGKSLEKGLGRENHFAPSRHSVSA